MTSKLFIFSLEEHVQLENEEFFVAPFNHRNVLRNNGNGQCYLNGRLLVTWKNDGIEHFLCDFL